VAIDAWMEWCAGSSVYGPHCLDSLSEPANSATEQALSARMSREGAHSLGATQLSILSQNHHLSSHTLPTFQSC
jgi:hypothetical protein